MPKLTDLIGRAPWRERAADRDWRDFVIDGGDSGMVGDYPSEPVRQN